MSVNGYKLGIGIDFGMPEVPEAERIRAIADVGFEVAFSGWKPGDYLKKVSAMFKENRLIYQSVHAPFKKVDKLWLDTPESKEAFDELINCIDDCSDVEVPIMICHVWIGFLPEQPTELGAQNYLKLVEHAEKRGVKIAFENTEGEGYLEYMWEVVKSSANAGFCIDTGHELCYNLGRDLITKYGKDGKLIATHINDNFGVTGEKITWHDDAHMLPFDASVNWQSVADRLAAVGYSDILTCELTTKSKPNRNTHDIYAQMDHKQYLAAAYERMAKFAALCRSK